MTMYYSHQSKYSDPGKYGGLFEYMPTDISNVASIVHGLIVHQDGAEKLYGYKIPEDRKLEPNARYVEKILEKIISLDSAPLTTTRPPEMRFIGTCRDFALLTCSILRQQHIPARLRCGFADYFRPDWYTDHWVCEYYDTASASWKLVDAELGQEEKKLYSISLDPLDVPRDRFLVAGAAWIQCLNRTFNPELFGVYGINIQGFWYIRANVLRDLASLNKIELLPWDYAKYFDKQFERISDQTQADRELIDTISQMTSLNPIDYAGVKNLYRSNPLVRVTETVTSYTRNGPVNIKLVLN